MDIDTTLSQCHFGETVGDECHSIQENKVWKILVIILKMYKKHFS